MEPTTPGFPSADRLTRLPSCRACRQCRPCATLRSPSFSSCQFWSTPSNTVGASLWAPFSVGKVYQQKLICADQLRSPANRCPRHLKVWNGKVGSVLSRPLRFGRRATRVHDFIFLVPSSFCRGVRQWNRARPGLGVRRVSES